MCLSVPAWRGLPTAYCDTGPRYGWIDVWFWPSLRSARCAGGVGRSDGVGTPWCSAW